jgi:Na+/proline symporter
LLISRFFLPSIYGKGLTIFEALGRGVYGYKSLSATSIRAKSVFSSFYLFTKLIGVSVKLLGSAMLIGEFLSIPLASAIVMISLLTYVYIVIGGLKAVVRTDIFQCCIFIFGGIMAHYVVSKISPNTWGELMYYGVQEGKFSLFKTSGVLSFLYGILAGIAYDAATHGVDQDWVQKLFGTTDIKTAQKALAWSALGSILVSMLFLSLGVIIWAYYTKLGQPVEEPSKLLSNLVVNHFPSPVKGLVVASVLAASMSTLDSSINALSACFWNDIMNSKKSKLVHMYIKLDNFIITLTIIVTAIIFSLVPSFTKYGTYLAYLATAPLLAIFICRMLLSKWIKLSYSVPVVLLGISASFLGMALNHLRFGFNPQLTILWGIFTTIIFMSIYAKITEMFQPKVKKEII